MSKVRFILDNKIDKSSLSCNNVDRVISDYWIFDPVLRPGEIQTGAQNATITPQTTTILWAPTGVDPKFFLDPTNNLTIDGSIYTRVSMRVRLVSGGVGSWEGKCWGRSSLVSYQTGTQAQTSNPWKVPNTSWHILEWDFSGQSAWTSLDLSNPIKGVRIDLVSGSKGLPVFEIDWVEVTTDTAIYQIDNVKESSRSLVFRSKNTYTTTIDGTFFTSSNVNSLVIGRHNFTDLVAYQLILFDGIYQQGNQIYDTGEITVTSLEAATDLYQWGEFYWGAGPWGMDKKDNILDGSGNIVLWLPATYQAVQSFRLVLVGTTVVVPDLFCNNATIFCNNAAIFCNQLTAAPVSPSSDLGIEYFEIGRLFIGEYIEPAFNISYGHSITWAENTSQYRPSSGTLHSDIVSKNKEFSFSLNTIPEADRIEIQTQLLEKGLSKDFFISLFPEDSSVDKQVDYSGIVKLTQIPKITEFRSSYYKSDYKVEEA